MWNGGDAYKKSLHMAKTIGGIMTAGLYSTTELREWLRVVWHYNIVKLAEDSANADAFRMAVKASTFDALSVSWPIMTACEAILKLKDEKRILERSASFRLGSRLVRMIPSWLRLRLHNGGQKRQDGGARDAP